MEKNKFWCAHPISQASVLGVSNCDFKSIKSCTQKWKMEFNHDSKKQRNEVIFSWKSNTYAYPPVTFNKNIIATCSHQKHLGVLLNSKLDFSIKIIGLIRRKICLSAN